MDTILTSASPNLAIAGPTYDKRYMDQLTNQLRLYFTTNDRINESLIQTALSSSVMNWLSEGSF